jgi:hypothetical protein
MKSVIAFVSSFEKLLERGVGYCRWWGPKMYIARSFVGGNPDIVLVSLTSRHSVPLFEPFFRGERIYLGVTTPRANPR